MERSDVEQALGRCELFRDLEEKEIQALGSLGRMKTYRAGETIFRQGDLGEHLYVVAEGQVFLERTVDLDAQQGNVTIGILGVGRALGCWSTLLGEPHILMSSALCRKKTRIVVLKGAQVREMMLEDTCMGFSVMQRLCFLLRDRIEGAYGALEKV